MPTVTQMVLPKSNSADEFEAICKDVLSDKYKTPFKRYGRKGQKQNGIDLLAKNINAPYIVAQCKNYYEPESQKRLIEQISSDYANAKQNSGYEFMSFIAITSMERDARVQDAFKDCDIIEVIFWDEIAEIIYCNNNLMAKHYPTMKNISNEFDLSFSDGKIHIAGGTLALMRGRAMKTYIWENNEDSMSHISYDLFVANKNQLAAIIDRVQAEIVAFEEVSNFVCASSAISSSAGFIEAQIYSGCITPKAKKHLLNYEGECCIDVSGQAINRKPHIKLKIESMQDEWLHFHITFENDKSGIYTFRVNIFYVIDGSEKMYQSVLYDYFHAVHTSEIKHKYCENTGEFFQISEKIFDICESGTNTSDEYEMLINFVDE